MAGIGESRERTRPEQNEYASLPRQKAGQYGRKTIAQQMNTAVGASIHEPDNVERERQARQRSQQAESQGSLWVEKAKRQRDKEGSWRIAHHEESLPILAP